MVRRPQVSFQVEHSRCIVVVFVFLQLRLVALNSPRTGNLHGVLGVDYQCYRQAKQASVQGSFRGLLASTSELTMEGLVRFKDRNLPVVNLKV